MTNFGLSVPQAGAVSLGEFGKRSQLKRSSDSERLPHLNRRAPGGMCVFALGELLIAYVRDKVHHLAPVCCAIGEHIPEA